MICKPQDALLASIIHSNSAAVNSYDKINAEYFTGKNRLIYDTVDRLMQRGQRPSKNMIASYITSVIGDQALQKAFEDEEGVVSYIESITASTDDLSNWRDSLELVELEFSKSRLRTACEKIRTVVTSGDKVSTMSDQVRIIISEALSSQNNDFEKTSTECIDDFLSAKKNTKNLVRVPFFFSKYNQYTHGGMIPGQICVVGARTGVGKTMIAGCQQLEEACLEGLSVDYYTMEMTEYEITERLISLGGYDEDYMNDENFDVRKIQKRSNEVRSWDFTIFEGKTNVSRIRTSLIKKITMGKKPDLIIIDHVHLLDVSDAGGQGNYRIGLNNAMADLKQLANTYKVSIVLLAQLRRVDRIEESKPPLMSDIRESTAIEQIADYVLLLHRPKDQYGEFENTGSIYNPKRRQGKQFKTVHFAFVPKQCKFKQTGA